VQYVPESDGWVIVNTVKIRMIDEKEPKFGIEPTQKLLEAVRDLMIQEIPTVDEEGTLPLTWEVDMDVDAITNEGYRMGVTQCSIMIKIDLENLFGLLKSFESFPEVAFQDYAELSPEEQDANSARFKREGSAAKQAGGRASGSMSQIVKYAMTAPLDVEKWMNETLKPAIKQGKLSMDQQFGTDSAKVGFGQRIKNMGKAMMGEGVEDLDDDDECGGYQSNKAEKRLAKQRRKALSEGTEVDYSDKDSFDDEDFEEAEEDEEEGGFQSNKLQKREASMRRGSLKD
jgi:hypothetical protein